METQKFEFFFQKSLKLNFDLCRTAEELNHPSFINISPTLVINGKVFTSTTTWKHKNLIFLKFKFKQIH